VARGWLYIARRDIYSRIHMNSGGLQVARGGSEANVPPLAARPFMADPQGSAINEQVGNNDSQCFWAGIHIRANRSQQSSLPDYQGTYSLLCYAVLLCFIDPRVRKMENGASSCPGIFSRTLRFYYVISSPGSFLPNLLDDTKNLHDLVQSQQGHA